MALLTPKKLKFRKAFKGRIHGRSSRGAEIAYGVYGLQSLSSERVTSRQIEAARQAMTRKIRRSGRVWIRVFPHLPVTRKPHDVRMGRGKGSPEFYVARVKPGTMMFEMSGVPEALAKEAMRLAAHKLPVKTRFVTKREL